LVGNVTEFTLSFSDCSHDAQRPLTASNRLNQAGNLTLDLLLSLSKMLNLSVKFLESRKGESPNPKRLIAAAELRCHTAFDVAGFKV
jgi:hypothetical protein